jgi:hypothetical protein
VKIHQIFDVPPMEMARQLTLMEARLINKIKYDEFLCGNWYGTCFVIHFLFVIGIVVMRIIIIVVPLHSQPQVWEGERGEGAESASHHCARQ